MFKNSIIIFLLVFHSVINIGILITLFGSVTAYILTLSLTLFTILFIIFNKLRINNSVRKEFIIITIIYFIILVKYWFSSIYFADYILLFSNMALFYLVFNIQFSGYIDAFFRIIVKLNILILVIFYLNIGGFGYLIWDTSEIATTMFFGLARFRGIFGTSGYASLVLCLTLVYFMFAQMYSQKRVSNLIYIAAVLILGALTGNRSFILGSLIGFSILFFSTLKFSKLRNLIFLLGFLSFIFVIFLSKLTILYEYFNFRFDIGFENRLYGETGIFLLLSKIDMDTLILGSLQNVNKSAVVVLKNIVFMPHNGLMYYLGAFGISVALLVIILYYDAAHIIYRNKRQITYKVKLIFLVLMVFFSLGEAFLLTPINIVLIRYFFEQKKINYNGKKNIINS
ncbi:MAG: hypothetical protein HQ521_10300 [Bacteroidetes bacterium]|nr:hypothetical protein [Bacteroidota bacterium]